MINPPFGLPAHIQRQDLTHTFLRKITFILSADSGTNLGKHVIKRTPVRHSVWDWTDQASSECAFGSVRTKKIVILNLNISSLAVLPHTQPWISLRLLRFKAVPEGVEMNESEDYYTAM